MALLLKSLANPWYLVSSPTNIAAIFTGYLHYKVFYDAKVLLTSSIFPDNIFSYTVEREHFLFASSCY